MSYKSVLVHHDATARSEWRVRAACQIASPFGARVTALYATGLAASEMSGMSATAALDRWQQADESFRRHARMTFEEAVRDAPPGVQLAWAEAAGAAPLECMIDQSRCADLVVLGQHDVAGQLDSIPADFVPAVALGSGKPVMVIPRHTSAVHEPLGRVLVAWDESASAVRALCAALPLLKHSSDVRILAFNRPERPASGGDVLDLPAYLRLHGVSARLERRRAHGDIGHALLAVARDVAAELVVMGCYGHSRLRERVFGGVTRTVLAESAVPVLMMH